MDSISPAVALTMLPRLSRRQLADFVDAVATAGETLANAVRANEKVLEKEFGLSSECAARIRRILPHAARLASDLETRGVSVLVARDPEYPRRLITTLGRQAPPFLFTTGNRSLLDAASIGFSGARKASEKGLRVARAVATILVRNRVTVVSGYAAGVDLAAHQSALEDGGTTVFVLAEGIDHFRPNPEIGALLAPDNHAVVSEFPPAAPWLARNAMQRNRTIIGLSAAMIIIESGKSGGTFACAEATLSLGRPLFVADYAAAAMSAEGNAEIIRRGGIALRGSARGVPNLSRVLKAVQQDRGGAPLIRTNILPFDTVTPQLNSSS